MKKSVFGRCENTWQIYQNFNININAWGVAYFSDIVNVLVSVPIPRKEKTYSLHFFSGIKIKFFTLQFITFWEQPKIKIWPNYEQYFCIEFVLKRKHCTINTRLPHFEIIISSSAFSVIYFDKQISISELNICTMDLWIYIYFDK